MDAVHHFYAEHAKKYGLEEAVLLYNIIYWIAHNAANGINYHDGRYWTFNTAAAFADLHPYWKDEKNGRTDKIQRIINSLVKQGAIIKGNYNATAYDRTSWYALSDELAESIAEMLGIEYAKMRNGFCKNAAPIPDNKPTINKDVNTDATQKVADAPKPQHKKFNFEESLVAAGATAQHVDALMEIRKKKRLTNTPKSYKQLIEAVNTVCTRKGVTVDEVVAFMVARKWGGLNPDWAALENLRSNAKRRGVTMSIDQLIEAELNANK